LHLTIKDSDGAN